MKISSFLAKIAVVGVIAMPFSPAVASTLGTSIGSAIGGSIGDALNTRVSCSVEATTKLVGLTQNQITYKVKYTSNVAKLNTSYNVQAGSPDNFLHQKGGSFSMIKGTAYVPLTPPNTSEMKFTYAIAGNPSVEIQANVNGVRCTSKTVTTLQPANTQVSGSAVNSNQNNQINGANLNSQMAAPQVIPVQIQNHTCQVLAEAAKIDADSLQIGAVIKFDSAVKGNKYSYAVRGYLNSNPNVIKEYTGMYTASSQSGVVMNKDGKSFTFVFDAKSSADKYVISATLGNIDCKMVYFPSPITQNSVLVPVDNGSNGQVNQGSGAVINSNGGVLVPSQNSGSGAANNNNNGSSNGSGSVAGQAGSQGGVVTPVGLEPEEQAEASNLNLLAADDEEETTSTVMSDDEEETAVADDMNVGREPDYIMYALLGSIFLSIVAAIILKTKGMM